MEREVLTYSAGIDLYGGVEVGEQGLYAVFCALGGRDGGGEGETA